MVTANDHSVQSALVVQQVAVEQTQVPTNNNPIVPSMNNTLTEEQRDNMQQLNWSKTNQSQNQCSDPAVHEFTSKPVQVSPPAKHKRRSRKASTPVVDDMVRRSTKRFKPEGFKLEILEIHRKPRKSKKVLTSAELETKLQAIQEYTAADGAMVPIPVIQNIAKAFCAVPPEEVTEAILQSGRESNE
ncbi:hypothetical protein E2562_012010 [Oryza meyeriana var. granulata]|uniref:Uncharacterized protein n=1 Tax=Oryza meyeriana var. granulata TaxID=110450 RepID=A0A6G1F718_9ORYZ|nr:hypothetical protein E2562_012010 [Oryza meyeriana var. granulata]